MFVWHQGTNEACELCAPEQVLLETELAYVRYDSNSLSDGHVLIVPKRHVASFFEMTRDEMQAVTLLLDEARAEIEKRWSPDGYNIGVNVGRAVAHTRACALDPSLFGRRCRPAWRHQVRAGAAAMSGSPEQSLPSRGRNKKEDRMRIYRLASPEQGSRPLLAEAKVPALARNEVLVRIEAASLNYRDLLIADGKAGATREGLVPLSDAAGRIHAVGSDVTRWKQGDRVAGTFFRDWTSGRFEARFLRSTLGGGSTDGVLAEFVTFPEHGVVAIPDALSALAAATLPCAAVTAWQALFARSRIGAEDTLLVQGTGGVALFGLQFARAVGARVIVISSSDVKLERASRLGAAAGINYRRTPDWDKAAIDLTQGRGVTHILELGGPGTFDRSLAAVAAGGKIAQIGVLTGFGPQSNLMRLQSFNADILGITVGSAEHFTVMNAFIAAHRIQPVVDQVFDFENAGEAYERLRSGEHFGKVVIRFSASR